MKWEELVSSDWTVEIRAVSTSQMVVFGGMDEKIQIKMLRWDKIQLNSPLWTRNLLSCPVMSRSRMWGLSMICSPTSRSPLMGLGPPFGIGLCSGPTVLLGESACCQGESSLCRSGRSEAMFRCGVCVKVMSTPGVPGLKVSQHNTALRWVLFTFFYQQL